MLLRDQMEKLINEMLDGRILLGEAVCEFEKIYIRKALERNADHLTKTAEALGIHRNTLSKHVAACRSDSKLKKHAEAKRSR